MKKAEKALAILKQYSEECGTIQRCTSDLSPLEQWLIVKLIEAQSMKLENINTNQDVKKYLEACLNDYDQGILDKEEILEQVAWLIAHLLVKIQEQKPEA